MRHPERYGPRRGDPNWQGGVPQSRARGLTRAILDTFPIVKFDRSMEEAKDIEQRSVELTNWEVLDPPKADEPSDVSEKDNEKQDPQPVDGDVEHTVEAIPRRPKKATVPSDQSRVASGVAPDISPAAIGRETCPICIVDFEEGDNLRVLPCEGKHRFHQECVDQWLLELSSSCPICREGSSSSVVSPSSSESDCIFADFYALETMIAGESGEIDPNVMPTSPSTRGRFSRYLRFARRRARDGDQFPRDYDPTYPPLPTQLQVPHQAL